MKSHRERRRNGTSLAEVPINLWVFVFFLLMPFIDLVTLGYRATFAYFGVRDATHKASLQPNFTQAMAQANAVLNSDASAWTGISYSATNVYVVQVDATGAEIQGGANSLWPTPTVSADVYLIRVSTSASCAPLMNMNGVANWGSVPGITAPITLLFTYQVAAENPQGLNQ